MADCYVACQGAKIVFASNQSNVSNSSSKASAEFAYSAKKGDKKKVSIELAPEVEIEAGPVKIKGKGPKAVFEKKTEKSTGFSYTDSEDRLSVTKTSRTVAWKIAMVRIEHAISDFLFGDVPLWIDFASNGKALKGQLTIEPKVFRFDKDEKRIEGKAEVLIFFAVWKARVMNDKRFVMRVEELIQ
jgi:hypothetical protein